MRWSVKPAASNAALLALFPLRGEITEAVADDLVRSGHGDRCGQCGKPFTAARKARGVARVVHLGPGGTLCTTAWLLCGRCRSEMQRAGGRVSDKLMAEARSAYEAAQFLAAPSGGRA